MGLFSRDLLGGSVFFSFPENMQSISGAHYMGAVIISPLGPTDGVDDYDVWGRATYGFSSALGAADFLNDVQFAINYQLSVNLYFS